MRRFEPRIETGVGVGIEPWLGGCQGGRHVHFAATFHSPSAIPETVGMPPRNWRWISA